MTSIRPYDQCLTIANDRLRLTIAPDLGASVLSFDAIGSSPIPIFRKTPESIETVFDCAMSVMLPWVNRISGGGIRVGDVLHPIEPNLPDEPFPNHGNGFQSAWTVLAHSPTSVSLVLHSVGPGPYVYSARYDLSLTGAALIARLEVKNRAKLRLPFGAGFHPWLPRTAEVALKATADRVWLEDARHIPTVSVPLEEVPDFDFRSARRLPERWINNSFVGWYGTADIVWPEQALRLRISSPGTRCYHVYSPSRDAPFFCFETETHIPDAANLVADNEPGAPTWLQPGELLIHETRFEVLRWPAAQAEPTSPD